MAADTPPAGGGGNLFTRKIGPLPMWGWVAGGGGLILLWAYYERKKKATSTAASTPATPATASATSPLQPPTIYQNYNTNLNPVSVTSPPVNITTPPSQPAAPANPAPVATPAPPAAPSPGGTPPAFTGLTLTQYMQALQSAGWTENNVILQGISGTRNASTVNPSQYGTHQVVAIVPHTTGVAGQYFANSVDVYVS
jgi:hypothetical protein